MNVDSGVDSADANGIGPTADDTEQGASSGQTVHRANVIYERDVTVNLVHKTRENKPNSATDAKILQCLSPQPEMADKVNL